MSRSSDVASMGRDLRDALPKRAKRGGIGQAPRFNGRKSGPPTLPFRGRFSRLRSLFPRLNQSGLFPVASLPADPSPHGGEILHELPEPKFPVPANKPAQSEGAPDIAHRPALPDHPEQMAVDVEDEEDDPVVDSGPGITDGFQS